jgi:hypothetical protein
VSHTYTCQQCGGTFTSERSQAEANAEAEDLWGTVQASEDASMAEVCEDCYRAFMAWFTAQNSDN